MKKFILAVFIGVAFVGCGSSSSPKPVLAEATTANAFKAYEVASVSTYLPSFMAKIYDDINNSGNNGKLECVGGGTIDVEYFQFDESAPVSDFSPVKHIFRNCIMHSGSYNITLNGTIRSVDLGKSILSFVKEGFSFKIDDLIDITYKNFPLKIDNTFVGRMAKGDKGSFFVINYIQNSEIMKVFSEFYEKTLRDVLFSGTFVNAVNLQFEDDAPKANGVYLMADDEFDEPVKFQININSKEYFKFDINESLSSDFAISHKAPLLGKDGKIVYVWQDTSETVHAQTVGGDIETNTTVFTPSFSK